MNETETKIVYLLHMIVSKLKLSPDETAMLHNDIYMMLENPVVQEKDSRTK